jgi:beta-glucosidase
MELYRNNSRPIPERVEDLLSRMTLKEKAAQLCGNLPASCIVDGKLDKERLKSLCPDGHGRFTQFSLVGLASPEYIAHISNEIQKYFIEETRLGIPVAFQSENLCGYPGAGGTLFPSMANVASTWEPDLVKEMSSVIGKESRAVGINSAMSPVIDVSRDPRWGRTYETFGEDPYLISQMGINYINGMQSDKTSGVACIAKHFLGYAETQGGMNCAATRINKRELYETFATPFEAVANKADVSGMMASYSEIDGMPVGANKDIARTLLRDVMKFRGMLTSDGAAVMKMWNFYHIASTYSEAGLLAKKGGLDTEIPIGGAFSKLPEYVKKGMLDEKFLDESVRRILTIKFEYGLFDNPYVDEGRVTVAMSNPEKQSLSEKIAARSMIMLKNDGVLPLKKGTKVAVIGPHADSLRYPVSGYTYPAYIEMIGAFDNSENVSFNGIADEKAKSESENKNKNSFNPFCVIDPEGMKKIGNMKSILRKMGARSLREVLTDRFDVTYAQGCDIVNDGKDGFAEAIAAAGKSDVAVLALGGSCGWVNVTGGEGKDRSSLDLPGVQEELLEVVAAVGKPVIVVLYGPGCFTVNWAAWHASAILQAWMPGPSAGKVVADVLDGTQNPGGKLCVTIPRSVGQIPIYYNHKVGSGYSDGANGNASAIFTGGYVDADNTPLYPFGFGLSYTQFALSEFSVSEKQVNTDGKIHVKCKIKNTGLCEGSEIIQLYTHFKDSHVTRPNKSLCGFVRVDLNSGEEKTAEFILDCAELGYYNEDMEFVVEPGILDVMVGTSSDNILYLQEVRLTGEKRNLIGKRCYTCNVKTAKA